MAQTEQRTTHLKADRVKKIGYRAGGGGSDHYGSDRAEDYAPQGRQGQEDRIQGWWGWQ